MQPPTPTKPGTTPDPSRGALKRLPYCIGHLWTTAGGQLLAAYPRSPYDPHRYLVVRFPLPPCGEATPAGDTMAVVDDFGDLVETHVRSALGFFHPLHEPEPGQAIVSLRAGTCAAAATWEQQP